jgi:hypothetical protein
VRTAEVDASLVVGIASVKVIESVNSNIARGVVVSCSEGLIQLLLAQL